MYALRAVFELAKRWNAGPTKAGEIAEAQAIPARFLEVILGELKHGGFVESRRGKEGGYMLSRPPGGLAVGQIIRFVGGSLSPVSCMAGSPKDRCRLYGDCAFLSMWERAREAVAGVYDSTTFQDLVDEDRTKRGKYVPAYAI